MDTNPDEEFSPNSYLLRACPGPQQAAGSGKETVVSECALRSVRHSRVSGKMTAPNRGLGRRWGEHQVNRACRFVALQLQDPFIEGHGY